MRSQCGSGASSISVSSSSNVEADVDVEDVALNALIPTNQTDVEMSWAKRQLEEVGESDEAILTWAKRVKASARTTPY